MKTYSYECHYIDGYKNYIFLRGQHEHAVTEKAAIRQIKAFYTRMKIKIVIDRINLVKEA